MAARSPLLYNKISDRTRPTLRRTLALQCMQVPQDLFPAWSHQGHRPTLPETLEHVVGGDVEQGLHGLVPVVPLEAPAGLGDLPAAGRRGVGEGVPGAALRAVLQTRVRRGVEWVQAQLRC